MVNTHEDLYDVVVIGAGNAAMCAAISAREQGVNVLVLERAPKEKSGGNSFFTDGAIRFAYKDLNAIRKVVPKITDEEAKRIQMDGYTEEDYLHDFNRVTANQCDETLVYHLVNKSYETILWMTKLGVEFELNYENQSFVKDDKHQFWGGIPAKTIDKGIGLMESLMKRAKKLTIPVWYDSHAKEITSEDKNLKKVIIEKSGKTVEVKTKSVVIACGSFEANQKMRSNYIGSEWDAAIVRGTEYNQGEGIDMAMKLGAQKHGQWSGCHAIGTDFNAPKVGDFDKPGDIFKKHSYPLGIMVNRDGKRFVDEGADIRNFTYAKYGKEVLKQPGHVAFQIYDAQVRPLLRKEYDLEEATFYKADTLEALADKLRIDQAQFMETVRAYNDAVQDGPYNPSEKDGKSTIGLGLPKSNWALRVDEGPFYAYLVTCGITFAFGGVHVNTDAEVLNENGNAIDGIFAAGEMVGGLFYDNYPGGSGLCSGAVYGKTAGSSAANYVKNI